MAESTKAARIHLTERFCCYTWHARMHAHTHTHTHGESWIERKVERERHAETAVQLQEDLPSGAAHQQPFLENAKKCTRSAFWDKSPAVLYRSCNFSVTFSQDRQFRWFTASWMNYVTGHFLTVRGTCLTARGPCLTAKQSAIGQGMDEAHLRSPPWIYHLRRSMSDGITVGNPCLTVQQFADG